MALRARLTMFFLLGLATLGCGRAKPDQSARATPDQASQAATDEAGAVSADDPPARPQMSASSPSDPAMSPAPWSDPPLSAAPHSDPPLSDAPHSDPPLAAATHSDSPLTAAPFSSPRMSASTMSNRPRSAPKMSASTMSDSPPSDAPLSASTISDAPPSDRPMSASTMSTPPPTDDLASNDGAASSMEHLAIPWSSAAAAARSTHEPAEASAIYQRRQDHAVMKIYYATNRHRLSAPPDPRLWLPLCVGVAGAALTWGFFVGSRMNPGQRRGWTPYFVLASTALLTAYAILSTRDQPYFERAFYGAERGALEYGACEVSVPNSHEPGRVEAPSMFRLEFREDPDRHIVIQAVTPQEPEQFFAEVRDAAGPDNRVLVFLHGFNVRFDEAACRTAQLAYDLKFQGVSLLYSWPSHGGVLNYTVDLSNAESSVKHFKQFLRELRERTQSDSIHVIAHSMGSRVLTDALKELHLEHGGEARWFDEVVLAAPDMDADRFLDLAPTFAQTARRVTLYASSRDRALRWSKKVHGSPRAGESGDLMLLIDGVETIDATEIDTSMLGHSYYGDNDTIIRDLRAILELAQSPPQRSWLAPRQQGEKTYWVFRSLVEHAEREAANGQRR